MYTWRALLYRLLVIAAGWGWLLWTFLHPHDSLSWETVGIFVVLSWLVKRAGFRIIAEVTHSLVNVVDVGALLLLGPLGGAIVGSLSSMLHLQFSLLRRGSWRGHEFFDLPLFDGAVKMILALAGGTFYLQAGGILAPTMLSVDMLLPLTILYLSWFSLDHLLWSWLFLISGGVEKAREFIVRISTVSLVIELAPLPFSIAFAVAWMLFDPLLRLLLLTATVIVALVVRGFALALRRAEERVSTVSLLNKFGQALVLAQLDERKLADLLYEYAAALLPNARFELLLMEEGADMPCCAIMPKAEMVSRVETLVPMLLPLLQERPHGRLLSTLAEETLVREMQRAQHERPVRGGALIMPLMANDELLGIFVAESLIPNALTLDDGRSLSVLATQAAVVLQNARQFNREQRHVRQLQALAEVGRMVASVIKLDDLLWQVVDLLQDTFGYYHVQIYLVEPGSDEVSYRSGSGVAGRELAQRKMSLRVGEGIIGWVAERGALLLVRDVSQDPRYLPNRFRLLSDTRSEVALPLKIEERVLGVLDVQSDQVNGLDTEDLLTLSTLADQIAIAIEDARLYVAQREAAWVTTGLLQIAEVLNPLFELPAVLDTITRIVPPLVGMDAAAIYLWRSEDQLFEGTASYGLALEAATALRNHRFGPDSFELLQGIRDQQLVLIDRVEHSSRLPILLRDSVTQMGLIAAPLQAQGSLVGVMLLTVRQGLPPLSNRRKTLIAGVAQQAAVAIQAATLYAAQQEEAAITSDLLQVAEMVASRSELQEILELVTRLTVTLASVEHCVVYLWHEGKQLLLPAEAHGFPPQ
nr:GAF domain-containing protein [Ardenticatenales bacterium]